MKVGDYVRTKDGVIAKITDIIEDFSVDCDRDVFDLDELAMMEIPWDFKDEYIIKSSPNIIDLIEEGDYVDGVLLESIYQREQDKLYIHSFDTEIMMCFTNNNIKSIVTKEQFSQMEYEVKKDENNIN